MFGAVWSVGLELQGEGRVVVVIDRPDHFLSLRATRGVPRLEQSEQLGAAPVVEPFVGFG